MIDDARQFVCRRCDRGWRAKLPLHAAEELAQVVLGLIQTLRACTERNGNSILDLPGTGVKDFAAADGFFRTKAQP
jgi:hypothetical protein